MVIDYRDEVPHLILIRLDRTLGIRRLHRGPKQPTNFGCLDDGANAVAHDDHVKVLQSFPRVVGELLE